MSKGDKSISAISGKEAILSTEYKDLAVAPFFTEEALDLFINEEFNIGDEKFNREKAVITRIPQITDLAALRMKQDIVAILGAINTRGLNALINLKPPQQSPFDPPA